MLSRINIIPIFRGHWKSLSDGRLSKYRGDWATRALLVGASLATFLVFLVAKGQIKSPDSLMAAAALFAGALLAAFTLLASFRLRLTELSAGNREKDRTQKDMLDESAAHILMGALMCTFSVAVLAVGMNFFPEEDGSISGFWAAASASLLVYVALLFLICLPRIYSAYIQINDVTVRLDGFDSRKN